MKVGRLGDDIGEKVKSAIVAKLTELGIHIDKELPDYVMVLVANKKSHKQMEEDLKPFLCDKTKVFTSWLHDVLKKLEEATTSGKTSKRKVEEKKSKSRRQTMSEEDEDEVISNKKFKFDETLEFDDSLQLDAADTLGGETLSDLELEFDESTKPMRPLSSEARKELENPKSRERIKIVWDVPETKLTSKNGREEKPKARRREEKEHSDDRKNYRRHKSPSSKPVDARDILTKKGVEKTRKKEPSSVVEKFIREPTREKTLSSVLKAVVREPEKPLPAVPSLVKVTPRPIRPNQPSCNLILKAVADAEKSVATAKVNQIQIDPEPEVKAAYGKADNISITLLNDRITSNNKEDFFNEENQELFTVKPKPIKEATLPPEDIERFIIKLDSTTSDTEMEGTEETEMMNFEEKVETVDESLVDFKEEKEVEFEVPVKQPFDRSRLGPKVPNIDFQTMDCDYEFGDFDTESNGEMDTENMKNKTRCKFWPDCDSGDSCPYLHPSKTCRMFPNCAFGDKCLYIHPPCKFAKNCLNKKCPYAHTAAVKSNVAKNPSAPVSSSTQVCMFFPNCKNTVCPFLHVAKNCRFGAACSKVGCEFSHPGKNPYKWVANQ